MREEAVSYVGPFQVEPKSGFTTDLHEIKYEYGTRRRKRSRYRNP
jgi:hypothetical protein